MKFVFNRGYLCCGCKERFSEQSAAFVYKRNCICRTCFERLGAYPKLYRFEACSSVEHMTPIMRYTGLYRDLFLDFKFRENEACGHLLGMTLAYYLNDCELFEEYSCIIPVPTSRKRMNSRGYNQTDILAEYVSDVLNLPIVHALERCKHSVPQSKISKRHRKDNVKNAFSAVAELDGVNAIIFDDVYTTGSTVAACAEALKDAGVGNICVIAAAHNHTESVDLTIRLFHR